MAKYFIISRQFSCYDEVDALSYYKYAVNRCFWIFCKPCFLQFLLVQFGDIFESWTLFCGSLDYIMERE